jgi:hypothetical protein
MRSAAPSSPAGSPRLSSSAAAPRGPHPNRVAPEIEAQILAYALEHPTHGAQRVANQLRLAGLTVSAGGVRGVWLRHRGAWSETGRGPRLRPGATDQRPTVAILPPDLRPTILDRSAVAGSSGATPERSAGRTTFEVGAASVSVAGGPPRRRR